MNLIIFGLFCALLYTIPREKSKIRSKEIIHCAFYFRNDRQHYKFIALGHELTYLSSSTKRKAKSTTQKMIWSVCWSVLIDNTFVEFGEHIVQQIIVISMGAKCCRYFPIVYTKTYQKQNITQFKALNLIFSYIDDVLSISNPYFVNWIPLIYLK